MKVKLTNVRLSFPSLFKHASFGGADTGKFATEFLLDKKTDIEQIKKLGAAIKEVAKAQWPNGVKGQPLPAPENLCMRDGDKSESESAQGKWVVKASTKYDPALVDENRAPVTNPSKFYGGCWVNGVIEVWAQDNKFGKRVNASLSGVQFVKGDTPFGSASFDASAEFDVLEGAQTAQNDDIFGEEPAPGHDVPDDSLPF